MEQNKTIFNYVRQVFAIYGIIVMVFLVFCTLIGEGAREYSSLYALGSKGLTIQTLSQLLVLSFIISIFQIIFLTDKWIKNMTMFTRNILFFVNMCITMALFATVFSWFPVGNIRAWIGFLICFLFSTAISVGINKLEENAENRKMEQALKKIKNE